uniref:Putative secreted protein n=1 Tax=Ixodes ricinus TaxID=34613 RepID=A0A6B0UX36_IXORI
MVCFMSTLLMLCSMAYFLALVTISSCSGESFMSPKPMSGGDALRAPGPANTGPICSCCRLPSSFPLGPSQLAPQTRPADSEHGTYGCPLEQQEKNTHTNALIVAHRGSKVNSSKEKKKKTAPAKILHLKRHKRIMLEFKKKKENNKKPEPLVQFKRKD